MKVISASKTASYYFGACESLADPSPSASGYQNKILSKSLLRSYRILTRTEIYFKKTGCACKFCHHYLKNEWNILHTTKRLRNIKDILLKIGLVEDM